MKISIEVLILLVLISIFPSCRTSYYAQHWFAAREYQPVKKGKLEMIIREKSFPVSKSQAVSWEAAYDQGMKEVNKSIELFCEGKYNLQKISEEKDRVGMLYDTSITQSPYVGSPFSGHTTYSSAVTASSPLYKHYTAVTFQCQ